MHDNTHRVLQQKAGVTSADLRSAGPAAATSIPSFSPPYLKPAQSLPDDPQQLRRGVLDAKSMQEHGCTGTRSVEAEASPESSGTLGEMPTLEPEELDVLDQIDRFYNTPVSVPATSAAPQVGPDPWNPLSPQPNPSSQSRRQSVAHAAAGSGDDGELHVDEPAPPRSKVFSPQIRPPPPLGQRSSSPSHTSQPECCHFTPERYHSSQSVTTQSQNVAATPPPRRNRADFSPAASLTSPAAPHGLIPDEPTSGEALPPNEEARRYVTMMEARRYVTKLVCVADLCVAFLT